MKGGDIGNTVVPRIMIVWENLVGVLPTKVHEAKVVGNLKFHRWGKAVETYEINEEVARRVWDIVWRLDYSVDAVTYLDERTVPHILEWVQYHDLPIGHVDAYTPPALARRLAYMPQVAAVYDPDPRHILTFGSKGRHVNPAQPDLLGVL